MSVELETAQIQISLFIALCPPRRLAPLTLHSRHTSYWFFRSCVLSRVVVVFVCIIRPMSM